MRWNLRAPGIQGVVLCVCSILFLSAIPGTAFGKVNKTFWGVAIKGYDTVAYFTEGRAVRGSKEFAYTWNDAKWYFSNAKHRDMFASDPERYAPQYGGH